MLVAIRYNDLRRENSGSTGVRSAARCGGNHTTSTTKNEFSATFRNNGISEQWATEDVEVPFDWVHTQSDELYPLL
ncbi:unnamed protein product [Arctogadus glacialis]